MLEQPFDLTGSLGIQFFNSPPFPYLVPLPLTQLVRLL